MDRHVHEGLGRTAIQHLAVPLLKGGQIGKIDHLVVTAGKQQVNGVVVGRTGHRVRRRSRSLPHDMDGVGPSANLRRFR